LIMSEGFEEETYPGGLDRASFEDLWDDFINVTSAKLILELGFGRFFGDASVAVPITKGERKRRLATHY
jgi:hypothetical protein